MIGDLTEREGYRVPDFTELRDRIAEAIAEAHDLDSGVDAVMRIINEEHTELREALDIHMRESSNARTHARQVEGEFERLQRRFNALCDCPWMDGKAHLDPNCPAHQRMD